MGGGDEARRAPGQDGEMGSRSPAAPGLPGPLPGAPPARSTPLPAGFGLEPAAGTERLEGDRVLVGGSPLRVLRLRPRAAALVGRWAEGERLSGDTGERLLARRLVTAGLFLPRPPCGGLTAADVTVLVPVRDRPAMLERLLAVLGPMAVVVVDDASVERGTIESVARHAGAAYVRLDEHSGPAAARNAGLAHVDTPVVAFVDSDCTPEKGWLEPLLDELADPRVAAVAPRVLPDPEPGPGRRAAWLSVYESVRSPLDRGASPGQVRPRSPIPFVPTATLLARRAALGRPCFDESLTGGEDVDLVWRLVAAGWDVRYQPAAVVRHAQRETLGSWLGRRVFYGATAGPLARRHGRAVAPVSISAWSAASWVLLLARRPLAAVLTNGLAVGILARRLQGVVAEPLPLALRIAGQGTLRSALGVVGGLARAWGPAAVLALAGRRTRLAALTVLALPAVDDWHRLHPGSRPPPLAYLLAHVADDVAYGVGVWAGSLRERTAVPLLPELVLRSRNWATDTLRRRLGPD